MLNPPFLALYVDAALLELPFRLVAQTVDLILGLQQLFLFAGLGRGLRLMLDPVRLRLGRADKGLRRLASVIDARPEGNETGRGAADNQSGNAQQHGNDYIYLHSNRYTSFIFDWLCFTR